MLIRWWTKSKGSSLYSWLLRVLPCYILWNLWKSRNKAMFDSTVMNHSNIITAVQSQTCDTFHAFKLSLHRGKVSSEALTSFNLPTCDKKLNTQLVIWKKPNLNIFKLNVDGASKGNPGIAGAGGLIRNSEGDFITGFFSYLERHTSFYAETQAIYTGLKLAYEFNLTHVWLKSDSELLVKILNGLIEPP